MKTIESLIIKTYNASAALRNTPDTQIKKALQMLADAVETNIDVILKANSIDVGKQDANDPRTDRSFLNEQRITNIASSIRKISRLPNPSGKLLQKRKLYNGLLLQKITVPFGVVGTIYESRPNVTFDIAALCLRSMNGCLLKGSSDADNTNRAAIGIIKRVLKENSIDPDCITLLPSERETVQELVTATKYVDVIIPRGSDNLIRFVRENSLVPVIETGAGVCHIYVEKDASVDKALNIVVNAKVSRPSVCNAVDTVLIDSSIAPQFLQKLQPLFDKHHVEIFADNNAHKLLKGY